MVIPSHNLAAGMIVLNVNDEILVVKDQFGWSLPKGSTEYGESTIETAIRELKERRAWQ